MTEHQLSEQSKDLPEAKEYNKLLSSIVEIDPNNIIIKMNCKFCIHPARAEAEEKYEKMRSFAPVIKFFAEYKKAHPSEPNVPKMNHSNVRTHLLIHYSEQERNIWKKEYADRIKGIINSKIDLDRNFEMLTATLQDQLFIIGSDPVIDVIKKSETLIKITKQILDIGVVQAKLRGEMQSVHVVFAKMSNVWTHIAEQTKDNPEAHQAILEGIDIFHREIEDINILNKDN
ncbi:hypothetical protein LCGC14_1250900 [marine sediment metagenome]|uniref:Uncharacterized protein n=1 Tax=marine sediment metagenome TaxID=412755 RepID=A0A0F9NK87_9ZZZZ